ncbi:hypothetical protein BDZ89DRAFT_1082358 [Hymenopellis radicata]|nr:hypothetical protein BDZ89DRAFT_1082358 [Hymenopellis radicata]
MPYNATIKQEAQYAHSLGKDAVEDFHATYTSVLSEWFPTSRGYVIDPQPEYIVVRHAGEVRSPLLIAELKRPSKYNDAGKEEVKDELVQYMGGPLRPHTVQHDLWTCGIGLKWTVCKMVKSGSHDPEDIENWTDDITSDASYAKFSRIAELVYNIS